MKRKIVKKYLLIISGTVSLLLGVIGIVIPVLPTTPFLLLSTFCYLHSSKSLYNWLINNKIFGKYIYNYVNFKAIKKNTKIGAIIFLWISLGISFYLVDQIQVKILLLFIGICVNIHIYRLKTIPK